jgi:hypothetical protein
MERGSIIPVFFRKLAFALIGAGCLTLVGYLSYLLFWHFLFSRAIPVAVKVAIPAIFLGFVILLGLVLWEAIKRRRTEHFEGIDEK